MFTVITKPLFIWAFDSVTEELRALLGGTGEARWEWQGRTEACRAAAAAPALHVQCCMVNVCGKFWP